MHTAGARRRPSGLYLESTLDERYGVLPGEDRLVGVVMTRQVVTIHPSASVQEAAKTMRDRQAQALVVSHENRLMGMVTEHDVVVNGTTRAEHPDSIPVEKILPPGEPAVCRDDAILADAARLMAERRLQSLPVMSRDGSVVGILSLLDVAGTVMPGVARAWLSRIRSSGTAGER